MARNKIDGDQVQEETLTGTNVLDESLTGADVQDETLTGDDVLDESLTGADVQDGSIAIVDLEDYSLATLRDVALTAITNDDFIVYNSTTQKFENKEQPRFGTDFAVEKVTGQQDYTGAVFQTYATLNFVVSGPDTTNKFRMNCDFFWGHDSASNDARFRVLVDGVPLPEELRIEPKDAGIDQRYQNNIMDYLDNLSIGNHSIALQARPASASRVTRMYKALIEIWRVS